MTGTKSAPTSKARRRYREDLPLELVRVREPVGLAHLAGLLRYAYAWHSNYRPAWTALVSARAEDHSRGVWGDVGLLGTPRELPPGLVYAVAWSNGRSESRSLDWRSRALVLDGACTRYPDENDALVHRLCRVTGLAQPVEIPLELQAEQLQQLDPSASQVHAELCRAIAMQLRWRWNT